MDPELLHALGDESGASAAADGDATESLTDVLADMAEGAVTLADDDAPGDDAGGADDLAAEDTEDEESSEDLRAEVARYRQMARDAEAQAAAERAARAWEAEREPIEQKVQQAIAYFLHRVERADDPQAFAQEYLPRLIAGYQNDLAGYYARREQAWEQIARRHATTTYVSQLQQEYGLSDEDMAAIGEFTPEEMEKAARLIARTRAPLTQELSTTKRQKTQAERAVQRQRLTERRVDPMGGGRPARVTVPDLVKRVKGTDDELGPILRLTGVA